MGRYRFALDGAGLAPLADELLDFLRRLGYEGSYAETRRGLTFLLNRPLSRQDRAVVVGWLAAKTEG